MATAVRRREGLIPTPSANDPNLERRARGVDPEKVRVTKAGTPRVETGIARKPEIRRPPVARLHPNGLLPTPRASEWKGTGPLGSSSHQHRADRKYLDATVQELENRTGRLNPIWVGWLMGFPPEWTPPPGESGGASP